MNVERHLQFIKLTFTMLFLVPMYITAVLISIYHIGNYTVCGPALRSNVSDVSCVDCILNTDMELDPYYCEYLMPVLHNPNTEVN